MLHVNKTKCTRRGKIKCCLFFCSVVVEVHLLNYCAVKNKVMRLCEREDPACVMLKMTLVRTHYLSASRFCVGIHEWRKSANLLSVCQ